ncbi:lipopolysaccharide biosynthesis protein [Arthrobacter sp. FW306-04-A]|uniref:lipopolysaccharide biosynthesis protein n=1 Tax=Arthrobacter sp. FW306-04-A TaxID=2879619 RepID=UPI0037BF6167|nr:hypothetical protein LFT43_16385 [Arthrobacter sp. FW306-04-A]
MSYIIRRLRSNIGGQAIMLAGTTGVGQVVTALLYILSAKSAEPSEFGLIVSAIAVGTTGVGLLDFGTNAYWLRELSARRMNALVLGRRLSSKLFYSCAIFAAWSITTFILLPDSSLWMAGPYGMALLLSQSLQIPLRSLGRMEFIAGAILADRAMAAVVFFGLILIGIPSVLALWFGLIAGGIVSTFLCWILTPCANRPALRLQLRTNPWSASRHYGFASVALTARSLDIPLLTMGAGASAAGIYAAVNRWTQPMSLLSNAFASASAPHVAGAESAVEAWKLARKSIWLLGLAILCCLAAAVGAPYLVDFFIGSTYAGSADVLRILALVTIFSVVNEPLFIFLQARGLDKPIAAITVVAIAMQLGLVIVLSPLVGALGAAFASAVTQLGLTLAMGSLVLAKFNHLRAGLVDVAG